MKKGCVIDFIIQVTFFIIHYSLPRVIMLQVLSIIKMELMLHTCPLRKTSTVGIWIQITEY